MKGIRFYNEYGDEFELHSFGHLGAILIFILRSILSRMDVNAFA